MKKLFPIFSILFALFLECTLTAYNATVEQCGKDDGITASGEKVLEGRTIACDFLPFGTQVVIYGHTYTVTDRIGEGSNDHIDIYMDDYKKAVQFGRRKALVEIIQ